MTTPHNDDGWHTSQDRDLAQLSKVSNKKKQVLKITVIRCILKLSNYL